MRRRTSRLLLASAAALATVVVGVVGWLRWNPLAETAGALDTLLPGEPEIIARFDPGELLTAPLSERLWELPAVVRLRAENGIDARVVGPVHEMSARIGAATLGMGPSVPETILGDDVVIALYGEDVLVLSRLYAKGRVVDLAQSLGRERLEEAGLQMDDETAVLEREGAPQLFLVRFRDVLAISTRRDLAEGVAVVGEQTVDAPPGPGPLASLGEPGARVLVRGDPAVVAGWLTPGPGNDEGSGSDDGFLSHPAVQVIAEIIGPEGARDTTLVLDYSVADRLRVELDVAYGDGWPEVLDAFPAIALDEATRRRHADARYAVGDEAAIVGGLSVRAVDVIRMLADAQPPSRRALLDDLLRERGLTLDGVARAIAAHLEDGISFVVARLDEAGDLELDDPQNGGVHPIPATLVAFDLRRGHAPDAAMAAIVKHSETLFGSRIEFTGRTLAGGVELFSLSQHRFGGEWELLRPAVALGARRLVFCTHEDYLVRALGPEGAPYVLGGGGGHDRPTDGSGPERWSTLDLSLDGAALRRYVDDQRWAWADQATTHDWRAEREAVWDELESAGSVLRPEDRQVYVDSRIARRLATRNEVEFPAAIEEYREMWAPLRDLGGITIQASADRAGLGLRVDVVLERP